MQSQTHLERDEAGTILIRPGCGAEPESLKAEVEDVPDQGERSGTRRCVLAPPLRAHPRYQGGCEEHKYSRCGGHRGAGYIRYGAAGLIGRADISRAASCEWTLIKLHTYQRPVVGVRFKDPHGPEAPEKCH